MESTQPAKGSAQCGDCRPTTVCDGIVRSFPARRGGGDPRSINTLADTVAQHQHRATAQTCYESSSGSERPSPNEGTVNAAFPRHDEPSPVVLPPPPIRRLAPLPLKLPQGRVTVTVA
jgi:hypothetical protein